MSVDRAHYVLDLNRVLGAVRRYNSSAALVATDFLLYQHFSGVRRSLDAGTVAQRVVLLDGLWATRLFMEAGTSDRIVTSLVEHRRTLIRRLEGLPSDGLESQPEKVVDAARTALPVILTHSTRRKVRYRQNYSFATKFFHWTTREHFPIVDSRTRRYINRLQRDAGALGRVRGSTAFMAGLSYVAEYERWVRFYSDLIFGLAKSDRRALLRADYDSQPRGSRMHNSLLRVLDKAFYVLGEGSGVGRL